MYTRIHVLLDNERAIIRQCLGGLLLHHLLAAPISTTIYLKEQSAAKFSMPVVPTFRSPLFANLISTTAGLAADQAHKYKLNNLY